MSSAEHQEAWPVIGESDLPELARKISESIAELERAFQAGKLAERLASGRFEQVLGPQLFDAYKRLAEDAPGYLHNLRDDAVSALLAQLDNDLIPLQVALARVRMHTEGDSGADKQGTDSHPGLCFKLADASFDGTSSATLRFDQMLDVRFWRIGFTFETPDLCDAFARKVVRSVTSRLASDLLGLQRILERFSQKIVSRELKIIPHPSERRFEHLILDILNEDDRYANMARLVEDFLEKTDIRVKYPGLERKRGARVQVTSISQPEHHKTKLQAIKLAEELVFLSPISLAEFVESLHGQTPSGSMSGTRSFALTPLWDCLGLEPENVPELASELRRVLFQALTGTPDSPLGPVARVPLAVRQLIRLFVETHAIASTNRLREREKRNSIACATGGYGFDDAAA